MIPRNAKFRITNKEKVNIPIVYSRDCYKDRIATKYELEYLD